MPVQDVAAPIVQLGAEGETIEVRGRLNQQLEIVSSHIENENGDDHGTDAGKPPAITVGPALRERLARVFELFSEQIFNLVRQAIVVTIGPDIVFWYLHYLPS